jgi:hypothetical protein
MEYLAAHKATSQLLLSYFEVKYQLPYDHFIFELHRMWMGNKAVEDHLNFYFIVPKLDKFKPLFDVLSGKFDNTQFYKLLNVRKNPFYKREENHYILCDQNILLEKAYYQFINDFWFDHVKGSKRADGKDFSMQDYKSIIGYFFETYVNDKIRYSFARAKNYVIKTFDELKFGNASKEMGDVYLRQENKVILAEVKSTSLYDNEKYGGNIDALYKNNRQKFFDSFGVDQLVNNIRNLEQNALDIDKGLKDCKKIRVWPLIIFNEKAFQTPMMAQIFNKRFQELLAGYVNKRVHIYPLTLVHVSDLETMESVLHQKPDKIWDLLTSNFTQKINFIPPFYITLNRNQVKANYGRVREKVVPLFDKYGPPKQDTDP